MKRWAEVRGIEEFIILHPLGFGNTLFVGVGEQDVFSCIEDIISKYTINKDNIFLVGFSMGGAAALNLAARNPSFFCGVCSISGYSDFRLWEGPSRNSLKKYEIPQIKNIEASFNIENLAHLNVLIAHGEWDLGLGGGVDYKFHRELAKNLKNKKIIHENIILEKTSHADFPKNRRENVINWIKKQKKKQLEGKFNFTISNLRHLPFFGIKISSFIDYSKKGKISGEVIGSSINLKTQNIGSIDVSKMLFNKSKINGVEAFDLSFKGLKNISTSGPIFDILYTKIYFCYDDQCSNEFSRSFQKEISDAEFKYYNKLNAGISCGPFREGINFFENETLPYSKGLLSNKHTTLVLYGTPKCNKMIQYLLEKANFKISNSSITTPIGEKISGNLGIRFIYPNSDGGYYIVNTGANEQIISKSFGIWYGLLPDFIIYDNKRVRFYGYFDKDWKFNNKNFFKV